MLIRTIGVSIHILIIKNISVSLQLLIGITDVLKFHSKIRFEIAADFLTYFNCLFVGFFLQNESHNIVFTPSMKVYCRICIILA